ncbi:type I phosphomannose isomerase catalytic subunit [Cytobacillus sp. FSL H8-0458]|uniref:type I phosphomannose isomerase catalytic subunit n=1 Tax=Cytobacillus sp. FSL H8-0458 TaxID=2975346 RepID=UPI0030F5A9F6
MPSEKTDQYWAISGHANGKTTVLSGGFQGKKLNELCWDIRDLFGSHTAPSFPMLFKLHDANSDLSVQVHQDDEYV